MTDFFCAYSRNGSKKNYVQDLINEDAERIADTFQSKGVVMICGSVAMQNGVIRVLEDICISHTNKPLSHYQKRNQLKMDCY